MPPPIPILGDPEPEGDTRKDRVGTGEPVELCVPIGVMVAQAERVIMALPDKVPPPGVKVGLEERLKTAEIVAVELTLSREVEEEVRVAMDEPVAPKETEAEELKEGSGVPLEVATAVVVDEDMGVTVKVAKAERVGDTEGGAETEKVANDDKVMLPPDVSEGVPDCTPVQDSEGERDATTEEEEEPLPKRDRDTLPVPAAEAVLKEDCEGVSEFMGEEVEVAEPLGVCPPPPPPIPGLVLAFSVLVIVWERDPAGEKEVVRLTTEVGDGVPPPPPEDEVEGVPVPTLSRGEELGEGPLTVGEFDTEVVGKEVKQAVKDVARLAAGLAVVVPELPGDAEAHRVGPGVLDKAVEAEVVMDGDAETLPEMDPTEEEE